MKHQNYSKAKPSPDNKPTQEQKSNDDTQLSNEVSQPKSELETSIPGKKHLGKRTARNNFSGRYGLDFLL